MSYFTDFTGYVLFIITSFLAGVESADQCLLNSKVLSCFSGVIMSIRSIVFSITLLKYVKSQRNYVFLITKQLIFGFRILDLKDHFSASLIACSLKCYSVPFPNLFSLMDFADEHIGYHNQPFLQKC